LGPHWQQTQSDFDYKIIICVRIWICRQSLLQINGNKNQAEFLLELNSTLNLLSGHVGSIFAELGSVTFSVTFYMT